MPKRLRYPLSFDQIFGSEIQLNYAAQSWIDVQIVNS